MTLCISLYTGFSETRKYRRHSSKPNYRDLMKPLYSSLQPICIHTCVNFVHVRQVISCVNFLLHFVHIILTIQHILNNIFYLKSIFITEKNWYFVQKLNHQSISDYLLFKINKNNTFRLSYLVKNPLISIDFHSHNFLHEILVSPHHLPFSSSPPHNPNP